MFDPQVLKYLPPDRLGHHLKQLHPGMVITRGHHDSLVPGFIKDLEWNFYDEQHRECVHDTYHGFYKVMAGRYFSVNVVRWGNLPIFMQVANAKIAGVVDQQLAQAFVDHLQGNQEVIETDPGVFRRTETTGDGYKVFALNSLMPKQEFTVHVAKMSFSAIRPTPVMPMGIER